MPQPPPPLASPLWRSLRAYQIFGANTEVGKTVFSTLLCKAAAARTTGRGVAFLKPVSTGPDSEADDRYVSNKTLFQYKIPVSPHIAAKLSNTTIPSNEALLFQCRDYAAQCANIGRKWLFVETAGGVHSPGPSGTTQADMYAPLRLPVVLVGDSRLGGISQTISAFESLRMRGYDVESVVLFKEDKYQNFEYLSEYFAEHHDVPVAGVIEPPERKSSLEEDVRAMAQYYEEQSQDKNTGDVISHLDKRHEQRISSLGSMATQALEKIWYPFTQHSLLTPKDINVIDSAHGDYFQTFAPSSSPSSTSQNDSLLRASFDGSASWWTQGLGHANPKLTLAAAYAAGRYGHVMFASGIHRPAMELSSVLLKGMNSPRLDRVFFSDNGSTGIEVALKMGLGAAKLRYGWAKEEKLGIVGLKGSYHGDTIGAMDCSEPSGYNEKVEWYDGKGHWFDYPTVLCINGKWRVNVPEELRQALGEDADFGSLSDIFDVQGREQKGHHVRYEAFIRESLEKLIKQGHRFGSVIIEPVVLGAGGMALVDPLFQRALVNVVRKSPDLFRKPGAAVEETPSDPNAWTGLPIIFDEVFTGLYRLGRFTSSSFLNTYADISVHAKLLTGGLVPLCTTLASENIFQSFSSQDKTDALLHGHSYTAHPVGCQVALESLNDLQKMDQDGSWNWAKSQGWKSSETSLTSGQSAANVWSTWPRDLVEDLSRQTDRVSGIWALGSVLAIHIKDASGSTGYFSNAAQSLRDTLIAGDSEGANGSWNVHCRVLGNVLYLMAGQKTTEESIAQISLQLRKGLQV
ncbi:bifunctional dethiobiotin synthetase/adenosylmethionine-8-amino-7-oxononanoate aminotransferase [Trichoderma asperellum]|uniref:Bifunctional dethiobiotin synthetase/adenosylmethionine-8-amino-7-oxononanoate aminotransferase n=1 Tax=Trichoderma asperellum TaxID=101201 RepID=A0A6V8R772_TRIAP|nr:bifunctional dethiobiotin synthetase/adenosylmethionine-8-amino-7-oxononanoate aminotransferase [Trichoderma asperellum]